MVYPKKMTIKELKEYAEKWGAGSAMDLLLLCGSDNFEGDYCEMMKELNRMLKYESC